MTDEPRNPHNLITTLTVELTLNSDARDPFDEADQLVEIRDRLREHASVKGPVGGPDHAIVTGRMRGYQELPPRASVTDLRPDATDRETP